MVFIYFVLYGLLGAVTGSFLNVCILRIPENQNFVTGRSHCPACGHVLAFYDMVPVLSWLLLKGRCRYCSAPVSIQYPAVELLTASAFLLCLLAKGPGMESALMCMFSSILITAAFIDARHMYIPDGIHILILILSCISLAAGPGPAFLNRLGGSLLAGGFLAIVHMLIRGGVGWGDVKLFAASGLLIGAAPAMTALLMGYVIAGLWYAVPLVLGRIGRKTQVPMAPFFAVSLMVCGLWFRQLILWYLGFSPVMDEYPFSWSAAFIIAVYLKYADKTNE